jgi:hypothetical protein
VDPAEWLATYDKRLAKMAADAQVAEASLRQVGGRAASPRGEVEVRVGPSGAMEDIRLTAGARSLAADDLAQLILRTAQQAQRTVGAQVVRIMTDYIGAGPALDIVRQNLPAAPVEPGRQQFDTRSDDDYFANPPEIIQ